jgi:hypothetical protein
MLVSHGTCGYICMYTNPTCGYICMYTNGVAVFGYCDTCILKHI